MVALDPADLSFDIDRLKPIAKVSGRGPDAGADRPRPVGGGALGRPAAAAVPRHRQPADERRRAPATATRHGRAVEPRHAGARPSCSRRGGGVLRLPPSDDVVPVLWRAAAASGRCSSSCRRSTGPGSTPTGCAGPGCTVAVVPARVGGGRGRASTSSSAPGRRRGRRARARRGRRGRRARRGAAGGAQPDVARPRRRRRAGPAGGRAGAAGVAVPDRGRRWPRRAAARRDRRSTTSGPAGRSSRSSTAAATSRGRRRSSRSPLIAHLRDARPHGGVRAQHARPGPRPRLPAPAARWPAASAATRRSGSTTTARWPAGAAARCARPCAWSAAGRAFANLRPGVTRLREELEAAAGRPVVAVTGRRRRAAGSGRRLRRHRGGAAPRAGAPTSSPSSTSTPSCSRPRYRAAEQAMALLVRGGAPRRAARERGGRLLVQTFLPRHEVLQAALLADPGRLVDAGDASGAGCSACRRSPPSPRSAGAGERRVRRRACRERCRRDRRSAASDGATSSGRPTWDDARPARSSPCPRPKGSRLRIEVDPPRR